MSLKNRLSHAANVTKWKADQQMRILKAQNSIHELENQIRAQKAVLADATLAVYAQGNLSEPNLQQICQAIEEINHQVQITRQEMESIKQELPPEKDVFSAAMPVNQPAYLAYDSNPAYDQAPVAYTPAPTEPSGLVCPNCGAALVGKFCPVHGLEGVLPTHHEEE